MRLVVIIAGSVVGVVIFGVVAASLWLLRWATRADARLEAWADDHPDEADVVGAILRRLS